MRKFNKSPGVYLNVTVISGNQEKSDFSLNSQYLIDNKNDKYKKQLNDKFISIELFDEFLILENNDNIELE